MTHLDFTIPLRTGNGLNDRGHWAVKARRVKQERTAVALCWPRVSGKKWHVPLPVDVHLTRLSPKGRPMDSDGVQGALKAIRDQVAAELRVDDGQEDLVRFTYSQARGEWGVRVSVFPREEKP